MTKQCNEALNIANSRRAAQSRLKSAAKAGTVTVGEVVIGAPDSIGALRLADIITWGWPRLGPSRQLKIGRAAARQDINVLLPVGVASRATRTEFTRIVGEIRGEPQRTDLVEAEEERHDEAERLAWLLQKAERERDAALSRVAEMERTMTVHQSVMPTLDAERMVADMADAIEVHRRTVTSKTSPPDKWANADEELWRAKNDILAGKPPTLRAVA